MTQARKSRYVLLRYAPGEAHSRGADVLILVSEAKAGLEVRVRPGWHEEMAEQDRDYLAGLMEDWDRVSEPHPVLDALSELSIGPLVTVETGMLDAGRSAALGAKILNSEPS